MRSREKTHLFRQEANIEGHLEFWCGKAHAASILRIPTLAKPEGVTCRECLIKARSYVLSTALEFNRIAEGLTLVEEGLNDE